MSPQRQDDVASSGITRPAAVPEILDVISRAHPLDRLPPSVSYAIATASDLCFVPRGEQVFAIGDLNTDVFLVRTGAVEQREGDGALRARLGEGEFFGRQSAISGRPTEYTAVALEDALVLRFPATVLEEQAVLVPEVRDAFAGKEEERLQHALTSTGAIEAIGMPTSAPARELITRAAVLLAPSATVREAAIAMSRQRTSMACVVEEGRLVGVLTDHDMRERVIAEGRDPGQAVSAVMTPQPLTVDGDASGFETMIMMVENDIRHVPVREAGEILGVVSAADLFRDHHSMNAIGLAGRLSRAASPAELAELMRALPDLQSALIRAELPPRQVTHVLTSIVDTCTRRLLQLAEQDLGEPPCRYVWLALGSQARCEVTIGSDQDNALLFEDMGMIDDVERADGEQYFAELARRVTGGLEACGIPICSGGFMATNPAWRQPISQWREYYEQWIAEPELEALLNATVFLDVRPVHGDESLSAELAEHLRHLLRSPVRFLRALTANALRSSPPLGFFRTFVLSRDGEGQKVLDIKRRGISPIIDIARIHAMSAGSITANTYDRLEAAQQAGRISATSADDLRNALVLISGVRLRHQNARRERGFAPNNDLAPDALTAYEQGHLKEAFTIVRSAQAVLRQASEAGAIG